MNVEKALGRLAEDETKGRDAEARRRDAGAGGEAGRGSECGGWSRKVVVMPSFM